MRAERKSLKAICRISGLKYNVVQRLLSGVKFPSVTATSPADSVNRTGLGRADPNTQGAKRLSNTVNDQSRFHIGRKLSGRPSSSVGLPPIYQHWLKEEQAKREFEYIKSPLYEKIEGVRRDIEYLSLLDEKAEVRMRLRLHWLLEKTPGLYVFSEEAYRANMRAAENFLLGMKTPANEMLRYLTVFELKARLKAFKLLDEHEIRRIVSETFS